MNIAIFGDSHSEYFRQNDFYTRQGIKTDVFLYPGATVVGLGRRTSTLGVDLKVSEVIAKARHDYYVFKFGQVDIELGFYYRLLFKDENLKFASFVEDVVAAYRDYLLVLPLPRDKIIVHLLNVPTLRHQGAAVQYTSRVIQENTTPDQVKVLNQRLAAVLPDFVERTRRILLFNRRLKAVFPPLSIAVADPTPWFLNAETSLLDDAYMPGGQNDHHYVDSMQVRKIFAHGLLRVVLAQ